MTPEYKTPGVGKSCIGFVDEPTGATKRSDMGKQVSRNKRIAKDLERCEWKSYRSIVPMGCVEAMTQTGKVAND